MLALSGIAHSYGVHDVSVQVAPGQLVGVLGPNGAGKSTLAQIALGLIVPRQGDVSIDGTPLATLPIVERARRVAAVLQGEAAAFSFTARELVALGLHARRPRFGPLSEQAAAAVSQALAQVDASAFADRLLQTLSGGERQRVFFARALVQDTPYLVLDEPTTFFDVAHTLRFAELVASLDKGVLWVLHDPAVALRFCDRVLLLQHGRSVAFGPPAEVLTPARVSDVFGVRAELHAGHLVLF